MSTAPCPRCGKQLETMNRICECGAHLITVPESVGDEICDYFSELEPEDWKRHQGIIGYQADEEAEP